MVRFLLSRYDRKSLVALVFMVCLYVTIGTVWKELALQNLSVVNWFLVTIWVFMTALLCWDVRPIQDFALAFVALACGALFEWWGTNTRLWHYFTGERPPPWILPAWSVAALATARIAFALERTFTKKTKAWSLAYWAFTLGFLVGMAWFIGPAIRRPATLILGGVICLVALTGRAPKRDVALMFAGTGLGYFLEYWGTSRACWTYYTKQVPPPITVMAHGYAQVVFARILTALDLGLAGLGLDRTVRAREATER